MDRQQLCKSAARHRKPAAVGVVPRSMQCTCRTQCKATLIWPLVLACVCWKKAHISTVKGCSSDVSKLSSCMQGHPPSPSQLDRASGCSSQAQRQMGVQGTGACGLAPAPRAGASSRSQLSQHPSAMYSSPALAPRAEPAPGIAWLTQVGMSDGSMRPPSSAWLSSQGTT
jgi:hypothetical protein